MLLPHSTHTKNQQGAFIANQMASRRAGEGVASLVDRPLVQTRITFNGGGDWAPVAPPASFAHARCDRCDGKSGAAGECALHLHGASSWFFGQIQFPSVYSHASAPGLLMASGNVGTPGIGLDDNNGCVCVCAFFLRLRCCVFVSCGGGCWQRAAFPHTQHTRARLF
jgi:hypothetical protein